MLDRYYWYMGKACVVSFFSEIKGKLYWITWLFTSWATMQGAQRLQDTDYTKLHYDSNTLRAERKLSCAKALLVLHCKDSNDWCFRLIVSRLVWYGNMFPVMCACVVNYYRRQSGFLFLCFAFFVIALIHYVDPYQFIKYVLCTWNTNFSDYLETTFATLVDLFQI